MEVIQLVVRATARSARLPASCQVVVDAVKAILAT